MSVIRLLPEHIANQIAAGEVVQRPASVVKELMENAIDANAKSIKVVIKDAGRTLIQLIDNGDGMGSADSKSCFNRHATSKISHVNDLFQLTTKGFRGEALASIAAIAQVVLKTKREDHETGYFVEIEANKMVKSGEIVCAKGSNFEVRNLFYNVPARRNFLKSDYVEFGHIREEFIRVALAHPECEFILVHNNEVLLQLPPSIFRKRIVDIFGKSMNEKLVPIEEESDIIKIVGFIGKPVAARKTRGEQYFFVNKRFFKDNYFNHALSKAFEGLIPEKSFPSYVIFFTIDPSKIDVNIHPTKTEIKFEEERFIYSILLSAAKLALGKYNVSPTLDFELDRSFEIPDSYRQNAVIEPQININPTFNPFHKHTKSEIRHAQSLGIQKQGFGKIDPEESAWEKFYTINQSEEHVQQHLALNDENSHIPHYLIRGNYLITNCKSGILMIHVRRATERIHYEQLMGDFVKAPIHAQGLLFPLVKTLTNEECIVWEENKVLLEQLGFKGDLLQQDLHLNAAPTLLKEEQISHCLTELIARLVHKQIDKGDLAHQIVSVIIKSSSQASGIQVQEQAAALVNALFQLPEHTFTSDGKPILKTISMEEIGLKFK